MLCLECCFIWFRDLDTKKIGKYLESILVLEDNGEDKMFRKKLTNELVLERLGEKRTLLNNILRRKANWICHILNRNFLLNDAIK